MALIQPHAVDKVKYDDEQGAVLLEELKVGMTRPHSPASSTLFVCTVLVCLTVACSSLCTSGGPSQFIVADKN